MNDNSGTSGRAQFDSSNLNQQLIIAGLGGLIEEDGLTFHEAMTVLEEIKRQTYPALMQMARERSQEK